MPKLWEKILAAKQKAEADFPIESHQPSWTERDMHIFSNMVHAALAGADDELESDDKVPAVKPRLKE